MNSSDEARDLLKSGGSMAELARAIGILISDATSSLDDLRLGLRYRGFVAEQAELAIERRIASSGTTCGMPISNGQALTGSRQNDGTRR